MHQYVVYYSLLWSTGVQGRQMKTPLSDEPEDSVAEKMYTGGSNAGLGDLLEAGAVSAEEMEEINALMKALVRLRETEQSLSEASQRYMRLSSQDMKALHYLIVAKRQNQIVTPGRLGRYLDISAASTTKMLNRLEKQDHIVRNLHPTDRRAFSIEITPATEIAAKQSVGRIHARRFHAAARLTSQEREVVKRFLNDMAEELEQGYEHWAKAQSSSSSNGDG